VSAGGRPGALVIGGDYQGLAVARSLGRRGVDVFVLDDEQSIARWSRYVRGHIRVPGLREEGAVVEALLDAARRYGLEGCVLFPTRDETVAAIARHREALSERYRVPTPAYEVVAWALDKRRTYELAARLGIPAPRTWTVRSAAELAGIDGEPPFVIKPAIKERFFYATGRKAWRADTRAELEQRVRAAAALVGIEEVVVQELIPGGGEAQVAYCAFFKDGTVRAAMTAQRARQHPPDFGRATTYARTLSDAGLAAPSISFLSAIGYYGLVELEYKYDRRDGSVKLLDVNPRTWGYHGLAQRAGVDFPFHLYADQTGTAFAEAGTAAPGVRWIRLATDLPTAALELAGGRLAWRPYLRSVLGADVGAVFSAEDPLPALAELALLPYLAVRRGL